MEIRVPQLHVEKGVSVSEFAYNEDKNFPTRQNMEDNYIAIDNFMGKGNGLFTILDGHGGAEVSEYCAKTIPDIFEQEIAKDMNVRSVVEKVFIKIDDQLRLVGASETGSTCCLAFIRKDGTKKTCYIANLGDSRAVLCVQGGTARRVSIDHKVSDPREQERIKKEGGVVIKGRVAGQLAISRALGDLELKTQGVSIKPDLEEFQITKKTDFLIIASDGLWDVCEDQKAVDVCKDLKSTKDMSKGLVQYALKNGSKDNVSVLIVRF